MRCVIARFPFDLIKSEVEHSMSGITPEPVIGVAVTIDHRVYPVMQVGEVITRQNRRDFTAGEMRRAPATPARATQADEGALGW